MIRRASALLALLVFLPVSAPAAERVTVATTRDIGNAALFLAAARGYFKDEDIALEMRAYPSAQAAVEALAAGSADLGLAFFSAKAFELGGSGKIKAVAAQVREHRGFEGNQLVASNAAYLRGLRQMENLAGHSVAITDVGTNYHIQLATIAKRKGISLQTLTVTTLDSFDAVAHAVATNKADAALLPAQYARELLLAGQARFVGWCSELDEQQLGALFASAAVLAERRATVERFLRAYRRGVADYAAALVRHDSHGKNVDDAKARKAAADIGLYLFPGHDAKNTVPVIENAAYYMDAQARLDLADIERQIDWYKTQRLIAPNVQAAGLIDHYLVGSR